METTPKDLTDKTSEHPRPQMVRGFWHPLNGLWDFWIDPEATHTLPTDVPWDRKIKVPFSPETEASGVGETGFYSAVWYRRKFKVPELESDQRIVLNFEAVDYVTTVWVNGAKVCRHEGGYTPSGADITHELNLMDAEQEIVVRAEDDHADLAEIARQAVARLPCGFDHGHMNEQSAPKRYERKAFLNLTIGSRGYDLRFWGTPVKRYYLKIVSIFTLTDDLDGRHVCRVRSTNPAELGALLLKELGNN